MRFLSFDDNFQIAVVTAGNLNPELIDTTDLCYNIVGIQSGTTHVESISWPMKMYLKII